MILKISTENKGWVVYDNFDKVQYKHLKYKEAKQLDTDARWLYEASEDEETVCVYISAKKIRVDKDEERLGLEFSIVASGLVFLCNDEGKTIERIN